MTEATIDRPSEVASEVVDRAESKDGKFIVQYSRTEAALAELRKRYAGVQFDLTTTSGDKDARQARLELVRLRTALDAKRVEFKAPALAFGKAIDSEASRLRGEILALEEPIDAQIRADESRREQERQRKAEAERQRIAAIRDRIEQIVAVARRAVGKSSADIEAKIKLVVAIAVDESFAELKPEAERAHAETLATLRELLDAALLQESEAARVKAESERLARVQHYQTKLHELRSVTVGMASRSAEAIALGLKSIEEIEIDDNWQEFRGQAVEARDAVIGELRQMHAAAVERERVAAEQAAEAERQAEGRRRIAAEEAAARQERQRADREAAEARAAEQRRIDEQRAELERRQAAQREEDARRATAAAPPASSPAAEVQVQPEPAGAAAAAKVEGAEEPSIKLGAMCSEIGAGFTMSRAFIAATLEIAPAKMEGSAALYTPTQRRSIYVKLAARLQELAA